MAVLYPKNFYPTPPELIKKMLAGIDFEQVKSVLEPSAGKGDIALAVREAIEPKDSHYWGDKSKKPDIDCIELDENMRHILKGHGFRVVADDFLAYNTMKRYDVIVANPPFDAGDKHLLKMLDMQRDGGGVICLLNAETLRNPYTDTRKALVTLLEELGTDIEYIPGAFKDAERKTDIDVALIKAYIPERPVSFLLDGLKKAVMKDRGEPEDGEPKKLADRDIVKQVSREYAFVAEAARTLLDEYWSLRPYLLNARKECAIEIMLHGYTDGAGAYTSVTINDVLPALRKRYWSTLFSNPVFTKRLTTNLRNDLYKRIDELSDYDPSEYNINSLRLEMARLNIKGIEDTILALFDRLSYENSWDKKDSKNIHYYNGWKTNKSWKINKKVIQPIAAYEEWRGRYTFYPGRCEQVLSDIEKVLSYLDADDRPSIDVGAALKQAREGVYPLVELTYIDVQFYKKGTCHITFKDKDLLAKFNLYGSQRKGWLPPSYGKAQYEDMTSEEQAVIEQYEGKSEYEKVIRNPGRYIVEPAGLLALASVAGS